MTGTLFGLVAQTSRDVGATRSRLEKARLLADCLRQLRSDEVRIGVAYLAGEMRQGRIGVGYAAVSELDVDRTAPQHELTLHEVDRTFSRIKETSGPGSKAARLEMLRALLVRATAEEQELVKRLLIGEVRQGALEGVMADAIASAAEVPAAEVRRAVMLSGDLCAVAVTAVDGLA